MAQKEGQKFIAHCNPGEKQHLGDVYVPGSDAVILIGPEGDFSEEEVRYDNILFLNYTLFIKLIL